MLAPIFNRIKANIGIPTNSSDPRQKKPGARSPPRRSSTAQRDENSSLAISSSLVDTTSTSPCPKKARRSEPPCCPCTLGSCTTTNGAGHCPCRKAGRKCTVQCESTDCKNLESSSTVGADAPQDADSAGDGASYWHRCDPRYATSEARQKQCEFLPLSTPTKDPLPDFAIQHNNKNKQFQ